MRSLDERPRSQDLKPSPVPARGVQLTREEASAASVDVSRRFLHESFLMRFRVARHRRPGDEDSRVRSLAEAQDEYVWDWSWPPGCGTLSKLPRSERYHPDFVARIVGLSVDMVRNHAAMTIGSARTAGPPPLPTSSDDLLRHLFATAEALHEGAPRTRPASPDGYADYYATVAAPPLVVKQRSDPAAADALFAWQRVAGANPMSLARIAKLPEDFPLTETDWQAAIGAGSLAAALGAGRLYAVDFTVLHGAPATRYLGRQKYLCGARAVFAAEEGRLRPVAIQLEPGGRVFTRADGTAWVMARYCVQVADANIHETMAHLGTTHMVMEAVGVAAHRQVGDEHPLRTLLDPHLEGTFAVNCSAKTSLLAPNGVIDKVFAARIDVAASLVRAALDGFVLQDRAPARELAARGFDDPADLEFPYREDVLPVYAAILRFVRAYVALYYAEDSVVSGDTELQAWVAEVGSPIGGALRGIRPVETIAGLVTWMTNILHIASAQHAAVNFPQFPFFSWGANVAGALWGPPPSGAVTEADLLALMPPWDCLSLQADTVYELAGVHYTRLGEVPSTYPRVAPLVAEFQRELRGIEEATTARDAGRLLSYPFLRPSVIPASINI